MSKTRWTARAQTIKSVWSSFETIIEVLEIISTSNEFVATARAQASGLYKKMLKLDFIACLMFGRIIFFKLKLLTETLDKSNLIIIDAVMLIDSTITILKDIRENDKQLDEEILAIKKFAGKNGVDPENDFKIHPRIRRAPKRFDENS